MARLFLLLFAGLKFGKLFGTVATMVLAVGVYALAFGWRFAVGIVAMLFIHEIGHYLAARRRGLAVRLPMFIPFAFAWTRLDDQPHDAETEAFVGLGGPLLGTVGAIVAYYFARNEQSTLLLAVAYTGFLLNLVNLIPLPPLDGGRITAVLSPRIWLLGVPVLGMLLWYRFSPMLLVIGILAIPYVIAALKFRADSPEARAYYAVGEKVRWEYALIYIALLAYLGMMVNDVDRLLRAEREGVTPAQTV
jgi:Zn-dependent protease